MNVALLATLRYPLLRKFYTVAIRAHQVEQLNCQYPWFPVRHFARNQFDNLTKVGRLRSPVVVVYGTTDEMIPTDVARSLFERVLPPKLMLETNAGHCDAGFNRGAQLLDALSRFWPPTQDALRGIETLRQ